MQSTGVNTGKPNIDDVKAYCKELNSYVDPDKFYDYYEKRDWTIAGEAISNWKAVFRSWSEREFKKEPTKTEQLKNTKSKLAIYGEDTEFTSYVDWFNAGGWMEIWKRIAGDNYKEKYEEQTGEKWIGE